MVDVHWQVANRTLLPAAAMLEAAAAAGRSLLSSAAVPSFFSTSIPAPLALNSEISTYLEIVTTTSQPQPSIIVQSSSRNAHSNIHMRTSARLHQPAVSRPPTSHLARIPSISSIWTSCEAIPAHKSGISSFGKLQQQLPQDQCSFITHPATLDCTLHLGASAGSLLGTSGLTSSQHADTQSPPALTARVPTAIACFAPTSGPHQVYTEWALMGDARQAASGPAAFSDYRLGSEAGDAFPTALLGLEARPAQMQPGRAAADGTTQEGMPSAEMLYSIQLQANNPEQHLGQSSSAEDRWLRVDGSGWRIGTRTNAKVGLCSMRIQSICL